jgi:hypothetical protein
MYRAELGPFDQPGLLSVTLEASDQAGLQANPQTVQVEVADCRDTTQPTIEILEVTPQAIGFGTGCPDSPASLSLAARITDDSPLREAYLAWSLDGLSDKAPLNLLDKGLYQATIGPFDQAGNLSLTLYAVDEAGNEASQGAGPFDVYECTAATP